MHYNEFPLKEVSSKKKDRLTVHQPQADTANMRPQIRPN